MIYTNLLGVHPECKVKGIDFCTGSLGQGLTYGAGAALAVRLQRSLRRAFVLLEEDGHDVQALTGRIAALDTMSGPPHVIIVKEKLGIVSKRQQLIGKEGSFQLREQAISYLPI